MWWISLRFRISMQCMSSTTRSPSCSFTGKSPSFLISLAFSNKHMMIDLGTGNNNKINWPMNNKSELIDIIETIYRGARKGEVMLPNLYLTKCCQAAVWSTRRRTTPQNIDTDLHACSKCVICVYSLHTQVTHEAS
eukprot:Blabericola_migrator_1__4968@NODE_2586_length_2570_cov_89_302437_g1619_i0_p4_GENE_NODE_2586_length_2570_cov_89_302437_g1619_i0NODE_2586_length_2570_cov_89_302437_g1619_i0_p4_ORF_typecomplete_len136_score0_30DIM1/PF02966_16/1_3e18_NODE_2586_length_2570_cov_89_302437_g1619_i013741781